MTIQKKLNNEKVVFCRHTESGLLGGVNRLGPLFVLEQNESGRVMLLINKEACDQYHIDVREATDYEFTNTPAIPVTA